MHLGRFRLLIAMAALASGGGAAALGFGTIRSNVTLGQPLSLAIPVSLSEGETLASECASAEVFAGDVRLPPGSVRVRVTQGRDASENVLRITTSSVVEEPVLTVTVSAGCPTRMTRSLVLLADPPLLVVPPAVADAVPVTPAVVAAAPPAATPQPPAPRAASPSAPRTSRPAVPPRPRRVAAPAAAAVAVPPAASAPLRAAAAAPRVAARAEPRSRLQLDEGVVGVNQAAVLAAQEQASAARATASAAEAAASAATQRMRAMEDELARLRTDAKAQTEALIQLRQQLALDRQQKQSLSPLTGALIAVAALLAALAAWLGWRLRAQAQAPRSQAWWDREAVSVAPSVAGEASDFQPSRLTPPSRVPSAPAPWSDTPASEHGELDALVSPPTVPAPTAVTIPSLPPREEEAARAMSVDEQIDLEQQADFFIALGHDEAAIDLLMAHMRSTGGGSPLPFLKLLEIHRRRDQREAYERTRIRFNQRFNSVAPDWQADPKAGRTLESYPLVIGRIQRAWPSPLDAMAELEALLFRRGEDAELFDLPAYQEVLFLYQLARDLHQAEPSQEGPDVDVLLPIGGRSAPAAPGGPNTIVLRPEFNSGEPLSLDLDLSTGHDALVEGTPAEPLAVTLEPYKGSGELPATDEGDDYWGNNPDARPTR